MVMLLWSFNHHAMKQKVRYYEENIRRTTQKIKKSIGSTPWQLENWSNQWDVIIQRGGSPLFACWQKSMKWGNYIAINGWSSNIEWQWISSLPIEGREIWSMDQDNQDFLQPSERGENALCGKYNKKWLLLSSGIINVKWWWRWIINQINYVTELDTAMVAEVISKWHENMKEV